MGSRYGGMKQIDPVGPTGEFIIDYSCHDALHAGYDHIVFVIKRENYEIFRSTVGKRVERFVKVDYAFQDIDRLPAGFRVPEGRTKPWGTAHALLCAADFVSDQFATINADDFYGAHSFAVVADYMNAVASGEKLACCMAAYELSKTLTENGSVSRGVCVSDKDGFLISITERTAIFKTADGGEFDRGDGVMISLPAETSVSMNFFGIRPAIFGYAEKGFSRFLSEMENPLKNEYYLPFMLSSAMSDGKASIKVLDTPDEWFGVTYAADKPAVKEKIGRLIDAGVYRKDLWSDLK